MGKLLGLKAFVARRGLLILFIIIVLGDLMLAGWQLTYNPKLSCNICHTIRPYVESYYDSEFSDNAHYEADVGCKDCHAASPLESAREAFNYVAGNYENPLPESRFPNENCLRCHRSYDSLIQQTEHYTVDGVSLNPHAYKVDTELLNPHDTDEGEMECYYCHRSHKESPGIDYCYSCHHTRDLVSCTECHEN